MPNNDNKNLTAQVNESEVKSILESLNLAGDVNATPSRKVKRDDEFTLVGIRRVNDTIRDNFAPLVFDTNLGTSIGTKHFASVEGLNPTIGRTAEDAVKFLLAHKAAGTKFVVKKVRELEERTLDSGDKYVPKEYELETV